jgi:hypothetical protein
MDYSIHLPPAKQIHLEREISNQMGLLLAQSKDYFPD